MPTYSRAHLSGSTSGKVIPVVPIASPGVLVHTAVAGATDFDEIYLWVSNVSAAPAKLTLQWGGTADPADMITKGLVIPANSGPTPVLIGQVLNGGLVVRAFSDITNVLNVGGYINAIRA